MRQVLFSESVLHKDVKDKKIRDLFLSTLKKEKQNNISSLISNRGGFHTQNLTNETLRNFLIKNAGDLLTTSYNFINNIKLTLSSFWINENYKHSYNRSHLHLGVDAPTGLTINYSGIYYLEVPKDSGCIYFESNDISRLNLEVLNKAISNHEDFRTQLSFAPKSNDFLIFPSYLRHEVEHSLSNKKRISVAFNFIVQND